MSRIPRLPLFSIGAALGLLAAPAAAGEEAPAAAGEEDQAAEATDCCSCAPGQLGCVLTSTHEWRKTEATCWAEREPRWGQAAIGTATLMGSWMFAYWLMRDRNMLDWDKPSAKARFTLEAWRFDNNELYTNYLGHPGIGMADYSWIRFNGFSPWAAMATTAGASFFWEFVFEFREKVSINDLITTPISGASLGEFVYRFTDYIGLTGADYRDGLPVWRPSADIHLETKASLTLHDGATYGTPFGLSLGGRFVAIPGYLSRGRFSTFFANADVSELHAEIAPNVQDGLSPLQGVFSGRASVLLFGLYWQDIESPTPPATRARTRPIGQRYGTSGWVGMRLGYRYTARRFESIEDGVAAIGLPGVGFRWARWSGETMWGFEGWGNPEFASLESLAFDDWRTQHPDVATKTTLESHGYSNLFGGSAGGFAEAKMPEMTFRLGGMMSRYSSIQGLERAQEDIELDVVTSEQLLELSVALKVRLLGAPLSRPFGSQWTWYLSLNAQQTWRESTAGALTQAASWADLSLGTGVHWN